MEELPQKGIEQIIQEASKAGKPQRTSASVPSKTGGGSGIITQDLIGKYSSTILGIVVFPPNY